MTDMKQAPVQDSKADEASATEAKQKGSERRDIPGNLTYTNSPGVLKKVLENIIIAERPEKFSGDFLATVLNVTGGSARAVPPILKRIGFLTADGTPTDLYSRFKSESGRSSAALEGLRKGFAEIFRRNDFAHRADQSIIRDVVVEITGLKRNDPIINAIVGTFQSIKDFIDPTKLAVSEHVLTKTTVDEPELPRTHARRGVKVSDIALAYNINIVLPESTNVQVFNAIFKSLRENLLDGQL